MNESTIFILTVYITGILMSLAAVKINKETQQEETIPYTVIEKVIEPIIEEEKIEEKPKQKYLGEYKITYYCACMKCCGKTNGITASGEKVKAGITVAAPKEFPFGTKLLINGNTYIVQDRGGAIKNKRIDIYCETHEEALKNGVDYYDVYEITE